MRRNDKPERENVMAKALEPWQSGATELIEKAIDHLHQGTDGDQRVAFLLLDVGVETLFRTFLLLPVKVTKTKWSFADRKRAAEGSFHDVVEGIENAAADRLKGINLVRVEYYHGVRNKLYHEGSGITISATQAHEYAQLAVRLLKALLEVALTPELNKPQLDARRQKRLEAKKAEEQKELDARTREVQEARQKVEQLARLAVEKVHPALALPSFEQKVLELNRISQSSDEHDKQVRELIAVTTGDTAWRETSVWSWRNGGLTGVYLSVLQFRIRSIPEGSWPILYMTSDRYPKDNPRQEEFAYEDPDSPDGVAVEVIEHSQAEILSKGTQWVEMLSQIASALEEWMRIQA